MLIRDDLGNLSISYHQSTLDESTFWLLMPISCTGSMMHNSCPIMNKKILLSSYLREENEMFLQNNLATLS